MNEFVIDDTIAAISTALGRAGIAIVRMSGPQAIVFAQRILRRPSSKPLILKDAPSHTIHYAWVVDKNNNYIDEVLVLLMRQPRTYTRQDVVEIHCHGGLVVAETILKLLLEEGARLARPGEFTLRAFLNGRIDLVKAEAIRDIVNAQGSFFTHLAARQLKGVLSDYLRKVRQEILEIWAEVEAEIDFPEDVDTQNILPQKWEEKLKKLEKELEDLLLSYNKNQRFQEGLRVVICGRPNVGKSSLLNAILKTERAIVSAIAGTTRDTIEEIIEIKGIPLRLVDTAGIIKPRDVLERKALLRTKEQIKIADLILLVFDGTSPLLEDDYLLMRRLRNKAVIAVINKIDRRLRIEKEWLEKRFPHLVMVSAKTLKNLQQLEDALKQMLTVDNVSFGQPSLTSLRQATTIKKVKKELKEAEKLLVGRQTPELFAYHLKEAIAGLDELLGDSYPQQLLEEIFSRFCIGK